jgi:hypothetical protein
MLSFHAALKQHKRLGMLQSTPRFADARLSWVAGVVSNLTFDEDLGYSSMTFRAKMLAQPGPARSRQRASQRRIGGGGRLADGRQIQITQDLDGVDRRAVEVGRALEL